MTKPLTGIRAIEISAWAFVPSAAAVLADWGADVIKIEPPTGDPIRALVSNGVGAADGLSYPWEAWNRGKKAIALDLRQTEAQEIVLKLCEQADVLLTSYLPTVREKLGFGLEAVRARNPRIIYATGTGQGAIGPDAEKSGYDAISFWSRGSVSASVTPPGSAKPLGMPTGAFGDSTSGMALAGGITAALLKRERTGEPSEVCGSLLGTAMWSMQMGILGAHVAAQAPAPPPAPRSGAVRNPLVNTYQCSDERWVALCMLQPDLYYEGFVRSIGRGDLVTDPRFSSPGKRAAHAGDLVNELEKTFAGQPLAYWKKALATQRGPWDVVQLVSELAEDEQARLNGFVQNVDYGGGRQLPLVKSPVQFVGAPTELRPAPDFGADTDAVLSSIGMDADAVMEGRISGAIV